MLVSNIHKKIEYLTCCALYYYKDISGAQPENENERIFVHSFVSVVISKFVFLAI